MILSAKKYLIACGTHPAHHPDIPCDGETIFDSDQILSGSVMKVPKSLIVVGAGVIGTMLLHLHGAALRLLTVLAD